MKKIFLLSISLLMGATAFAQTGMTGKDARFGVKAGVNLSQLYFSGFAGASTVNDYTKNNIGYNITAFGDFGVGKNFFIQPGVSLQNKGSKVEDPTLGSITQNIMAIEIPVNAVLRIPTGAAGAIQISAGPYVGFNIDGKQKTTVLGGTETETDLKFGKDVSDNYSGTDFGANFGLGYRLNNGFTINSNYGLGLTNMFPKDQTSGNNNKAVNRVLGFSVGYSF